MNIELQNNIENILEKDYQYFVKYVFDTDNYIVGISKDTRTDKPIVFAFNKCKNTITFINLDYDMRVICKSYKSFNKEEYKDQIEYFGIDYQVAEAIRNNEKHFKFYRIHANYSIIFNKKNSKTLEQAIAEINMRHFRNVICNRIFGEENDKIFILCEEIQGGIKYDLIGIVTLSKYYSADVVFYKIPEFLHNLDYEFFDKDITEFCNNNDKFKTLRMLQ